MQRAAAARHAQLSRFAGLCGELGESQGAVALAWLLHQPGLIATIIGPGGVAQLTSVLHAPEIMLSADVLAKIDAIFPPIGPAPEAYAW